jgi:hypothetical protein
MSACDIGWERPRPRLRTVGDVMAENTALKAQLAEAVALLREAMCRYNDDDIEAFLAKHAKGADK